MDLKGQRILFIAPKFFGYEAVIKQELEAKGAVVDYFSDRPGEDFLTKALIRINRRLIAFKTNRYYDEIIEKGRRVVYDQILIVRGEAISRKRLQQLRGSQPGAIVSLYLWDSMHYNPNAKKIYPLFDRVYSFDRLDADKYEGIGFLPLFYGKDYERAANYKGEKKYDACFVGTVHTDRYKVLERIIHSLETDGLRVFVFCYYPSKILYRLRCLFDSGFRKFGNKHVVFEGMSMSEVVQCIAESKAVIDVNRPGQLGMTMRTIETVGAQRKLITTNTDIVNYDIFSESGVMVVDRQSPKIDREFLAGDGVPYANHIRLTYSVSSWVDSIFSVQDEANEIMTSRNIANQSNLDC